MRNQSYDSFGNTFKRGFMRMPVALRTIIAINAVIFVIQLLVGPSLNTWIKLNFGFVPNFPTIYLEPWRIITYGFLHSDFMHFLFNMLWLWWMGRAVEDTIGPRSFLTIYFSALVAGALFHFSSAFIFDYSLVIGASAAVNGIMVAFAVLFPRTPIMLFLLPPIEARYLVAGLVAIDILLLNSGSNVAHFAHIGGASVGYLFTKAHQNGTDLSKVIRYFEYLFGRVKPSPSSKPKNKNMSIVKDVEIVEEVDQTELDEILEKISKNGYDALTKEEKQKLFELSKKN
ncbi:MAG: rhomboid family intramembrane serine protease [Balneola sp.]